MRLFDSETQLAGITSENTDLRWVTTGTIAFRPQIATSGMLGDPMLEHLCSLTDDKYWPWNYIVGQNPDIGSVAFDSDGMVRTIDATITRFSSCDAYQLDLLELMEHATPRYHGLRIAITVEDLRNDPEIPDRWRPGIVLMNSLFAEFLDGCALTPSLVPCSSPVIVWKNRNLEVMAFHKSTYSRSMVPSDIMRLSKRVNDYSGELG